MAFTVRTAISSLKELLTALSSGTAGQAVVIGSSGFVAQSATTNFFSATGVGTGSAQTIAHTLGAVPSVVLLSATDTDAASGASGVFALTAGAKSATGVSLTGTSGVKFHLLAYKA